MVSRRAFLGSAMAALAPGMSWADAGNPAFLAAARHGEERFLLHGLHEDGAIAFSLPLPGRGHAAAAHPERPEAVAFARRPGTYALVIDCAAGTVLAELSAPPGHHFYGHGAFTADGAVLVTTESHIASGDGRLGFWDTAAGYRRIGAVPSGGIGPHEVIRLPGDRFAIANGGIRTHPATEREKLNLDTMRPSLAIVDADGGALDQMRLDADLHQNSIRHIAADAQGTVAFAMQWQGDPFEAPPLLGLYRPGEAPVLLKGAETALMRSQGYAGSVAFSGDGARVGFTAPRGNLAVVYDAAGHGGPGGGGGGHLRHRPLCHGSYGDDRRGQNL
ncbi:MAG: DUF1513 domain-containing protein, partial [Pseudomonadota bacterium]